MFISLLITSKSIEITLQPNEVRDITVDKECAFFAINPEDVVGKACPYNTSNCYNVFGKDYSVVNYSSYGGKLTIQNPNSKQIKFLYEMFNYTNECNALEVTLNPQLNKKFKLTKDKTIRMHSVCIMFIGPYNFTTKFNKNEVGTYPYLKVNGILANVHDKIINNNNSVYIHYYSPLDNGIIGESNPYVEIINRSLKDGYKERNERLLKNSDFLCLNNESSYNCNIQHIKSEDVGKWDVIGLHLFYYSVFFLILIIFIFTFSGSRTYNNTKTTSNNYFSYTEPEETPMERFKRENPYANNDPEFIRIYGYVY